MFDTQREFLRDMYYMGILIFGAGVAVALDVWESFVEYWTEEVTP